jgi:NADH-quinone oxidoreductase subunit L
MFELIKIVPLFPLFGFIFLGIFGKKIKNEKVIGWFGSLMVFIGFIISALLFIELLNDKSVAPVVVPFFTWINVGNFSINISYQVDQLSLLFSLIVTGVGFLIHVYSIGYMHGDRSFYRFFAYLNLFIFMMLNLVLSSNFLLTFLGWEGVGLSSYLLIGFWYDKKFDGVRIKWTGDAANKAFIVNRIGDFGFLIAMFMIYITFNTLEYNEVSSIASANSAMYLNTGIITAITVLMFIGCTGKSAQLPLSVWLPDAMAGPTSVSALIHAATMVTAGIFLVARNSVLFALSPTTMTIIAVVGVTTAIVAASIGIVQNDIKKVLAYSTVSQLGFMFAALGVGAFYIGVFHVMTHAFFKGLLFLGSGSVIHGMHEEQNIKKMGGLAKHMPTTHWTFLVGTLAIAGIPLFSGFFSKDEILWYAYSQGGWGYWLVLSIAAIFTAFYMFRLYYLTFKGNERFDAAKVHPHESPKTMTFALVTLAILSAIGGFLNVPHALTPWSHGDPLLKSWLKPVFAEANHILHHGGHHGVEPMMYVLMIVATSLGLLMWWVAKKWYIDQDWKPAIQMATSNPKTHRFLMDKWRFDEFYWAVIVDPIIKMSRSILWKFTDVNVIDGIVNGTAKVTDVIGDNVRKMQSGIAQNYAILMVAGIIAVISFLVFA